jgi:hypothetical protein
MEKYLFTDGTNVIREVESKEELASLIQSSPDSSKIRIWVFNSSEWISAADFNKRSRSTVVPFTTNKKTEQQVITKEEPKQVKRRFDSGLLKKMLIGILVPTGIFLVYNFTRVSWKKTTPLTVMAERPANSPALDVDSLIEEMEWTRGLPLDKTTRTNLRIRNTWPDRVQLQLTTDRDVSREGYRYYNLEFSIDNSTGYNLDNATIELSVWKNGFVTSSDTIVFNNIGYAAPARRNLETVYRGDSVSVAFSSIRARSFNFCYSSDKKSNYGNYSDRWFCK